jgi:CRP/FNR family transcriptional regulator, nitrogen fixation regulation protein
VDRNGPVVAVQYRLGAAWLLSGMFVNLPSDKMTHLNSLQDFGLMRKSNSAECASEVFFEKGTRIYGDNEPADTVYQVKTGAVRSFKLLSDGRRQIGAFHLAGDIFGMTKEENHRFTTEAIVDTTLWLVRRQSLDLADADGAFTRELLSMTVRNLQHAEDQLLLLGRKDSLEKVAAFLLEMDKRVAGTGAITLPMTRRDIADYLGLTLETVSRALTRLKRKGAIGFTDATQREIMLLNKQRLLVIDPQD